MTGLAQWADVAMRTHNITGDEILLDQAIKTMYYLKSKQYSGAEPDLYGSLPGSVPLWENTSVSVIRIGREILYRRPPLL